jgi:hypothetical protein
MALDKFLAKKMLVLYYSWLQDTFVGLYVRTVMGYNGSCTWDSVVQTGMKKTDFVQLYKQPPKYMVITVFRIGGVARSFCREERVIKMATRNRSHQVLNHRNYVLNFLLFDSVIQSCWAQKIIILYLKYSFVPAFGRPTRPRHLPSNYPSCGPDQNTDPHAVWKRKQHSECNESICLECSVLVNSHLINHLKISGK